MPAIRALLEFVEGREKGISEIGYLRQVERKIEECLVECSPDSMRPELFSVYLLLSHVFNMLTGDIRYHQKSSAIAGDIFNAIIKLVDDLMQVIKVGDDKKNDFELSYGDTVRVYLKGLVNINELIKNEE